MGVERSIAASAREETGSMSLKKQIAVVLVLLLALAGGVHWFAGDAGDKADAATARGDQPIAVDIVTVEPTRLARKVEAVGTTRARQSIDIRPSASGRLIEVPFMSGSPVREGDLLARLDSASEEADVAEARAERRQASLALERATALAERNTIALATLDELEAAFDAADARVQRVEKSLADRRIEAPFDGVIGLKRVDVGARVDEDTVIATLDDLAEIEIDFRAPEIYFGEVSTGQKIEATSAAFDTRSFEGSIATIDSRIDPVSRAFQVRARLPNPDLALPAGMFMLVELTLAERDALTVPEAAVTLFDREASVFVVADGKAERRLVELGQREVGHVEVTAGLEAGEQVVVSGLQRLRPGARVTAAEAPSS